MTSTGIVIRWLILECEAGSDRWWYSEMARVCNGSGVRMKIESAMDCCGVLNKFMKMEEFAVIFLNGS